MIRPKGGQATLASSLLLGFADAHLLRPSAIWGDPRIRGDRQVFGPQPLPGGSANWTFVHDETGVDRAIGDMVPYAYSATLVEGDDDTQAEAETPTGWRIKMVRTVYRVAYSPTVITFTHPEHGEYVFEIKEDEGSVPLEDRERVMLARLDREHAAMFAKLDSLLPPDVTAFIVSLSGL
jgi:hypothetical protein